MALDSSSTRFKKVLYCIQRGFKPMSGALYALKRSQRMNTRLDVKLIVGLVVIGLVGIPGYTERQIVSVIQGIQQEIVQQDDSGELQTFSDFPGPAEAQTRLSEKDRLVESYQNRKSHELYYEILSRYGEVVDPPGEPILGPEVPESEDLECASNYRETIYFNAARGYRFESMTFEISGWCGAREARISNKTGKPIESYFKVTITDEGRTRFRTFKYRNSSPETHRGTIRWTGPQKLVYFSVREVYAKLYYWRVRATFQPVTSEELAKSSMDHFCAQERPPFRTYGKAEESVREQITSANRGAYNASLLRDRNGRVWLTYNDAGNTGDGTWDKIWDKGHIKGNIWMTTSQDGVGWEEPWKVGINSQEADFQPRLFQDKAGVYWLVWVSRRRGDEYCDIYLSSSLDGRKWRPAWRFDVKYWQATGKRLTGPVTTGFAYPSLTQDKSGTFWLCCVTDRHSTFMGEGTGFAGYTVVASSKDCRTWAGPIPVRQRSMSRYPSIICDNKGILRVAIGTKNTLFVMSSEDGIMWERTGQFRTPHTSPRTSSQCLLQDSLGRYHLLYSAGRNETAGIHYTVSMDCASWKAPQRIWPREGSVIGYYCLSMIEQRERNFLIVWSSSHWLFPRPIFIDRLAKGVTSDSAFIVPPDLWQD